MPTWSANVSVVPKAQPISSARYLQVVGVANVVFVVVNVIDGAKADVFGRFRAPRHTFRTNSP